MPGVGLTTAIGKASPIILREKDEQSGREAIAIHSSLKMTLFYGLIAGVLFVSLVLVWVGVGSTSGV